MKQTKGESFYNLLEFVLTMDESPSVLGNDRAVFEHLMTEFFFKHECEEKSILAIFKNMELPKQFKGLKSLLYMPLDSVSGFVNAETINDTFSGQVMLSRRYLKCVYPLQEPEFKMLPVEIQLPLIDRIKEKNRNIIKAFEKMHSDIEGDRNRTVMKLIALVIKNVHLKSGFPLKSTKRPASEIINENYNGCTQIFNGDPEVVASLIDDKKIRLLAKEFFLVHSHKDIIEISGLLKKEFKRFVWRISKIMQI